MESNDSFESLISLVSSMNDEAHSSSEFDETDFVNEMENYLNSDFESDNRIGFVGPIAQGCSLHLHKFDSLHL